MRVASREALQRAESKWEELRAGAPDLLASARELFGVYQAVAANERLANSLTDPAYAGEAKAALAQRVFSSQCSQPVVQLVASMAADRWSHADDFAESLEDMAIVVALGEAAQHDRLDVVEDEAFRLAQMVVRNPQLQAFLGRYDLSPAQRAQTLRQLLENQADPTTTMLAGQAVELATRHRGPAAFLRHAAQLAAQQRNSLVASVTAVQPLSQAQEARLTQILEAHYGKPVRVHVTIDRAVLGGLRIRVGAEVYDGTILTKLNDARQRVKQTQE